MRGCDAGATQSQCMDRAISCRTSTHIDACCVGAERRGGVRLGVEGGGGGIEVWVWYGGGRMRMSGVGGSEVVTTS